MKRLFLFALLALLFSACKGPKNVIYFKESIANDTSSSFVPVRELEDPKVQPDDILAINVSSIQSLLDKNASQLSVYNSGGTQFSILASSGGQGGVAGVATTGYLVDPLGYITFPVIGQVKVGGLTMRQVKDTMAAHLASVIKEPVVEARILNYKVTLLGEIPRPGPILAPNHKITILDAIAAAGDIPISGRKDNILIIRDYGGQRQMGRINLNNKDVFSSPFYYLKQNDIVYIEPVKLRRQENNEFLRFYLPVISSLISTGLAVYGITQLANK